MLTAFFRIVFHSCVANRIRIPTSWTRTAVGLDSEKLDSEHHWFAQAVFCVLLGLMLWYNTTVDCTCFKEVGYWADADVPSNN